MTVIETIKKTLPTMPPLFRKIGLYILENDEDISFTSIHAFGEAVGVSAATVIRFSKSLGFEGYADLKRSAQARIKSRLDPYEKIALSEIDREPIERQLDELRQNEINNLKRTLDDLDAATLSNIVAWIVGAERVFLSGFGVSSHIIQILGNAISSSLGSPVISITGSVSDYAPRLQGIGPKDALLVMTFPPYSREAFHVSELARSRGSRVVLFTDSPRCPAYAYADASIRCENNSLLMANSYVGLIAVVQVLANMLCLKDKKAATKRLKELSELERSGYARLAATDTDL